MTYRSGSTCSCGHDVIDHDGTGCDERDCACSTPVDELLAPPEAEPLEPVDLSKPLVAVWCDRCQVWALPHAHGTAYV